MKAKQIRKLINKAIEKDNNNNPFLSLLREISPVDDMVTECLGAMGVV